MSKNNIRGLHLNYEEISRVLKEDMKAPIETLANQIAAAVDVGDVPDAPVGVRMVETDRAHANITIMHPAGVAMELKHGTLRRAAASLGLEVTSKKRGKAL